MMRLMVLGKEGKRKAYTRRVARQMRLNVTNDELGILGRAFTQRPLLARIVVREQIAADAKGVKENCACL